jgi:hypothetical protein
MMRRTPPAAALLLAALLLAACFEDPVEETLRLDLAPHGVVEATAVVRIPAHHLNSGNPHLEHRLRRQQQAMAQGWDAWPARFAAAEPWDEAITFRRQQGELLEVERSALLGAPDAVERFFADRMTATYAWDEEAGRGELVLYPTTGGPATGAERQQVERALGGWSGAVASYLAAAGALYRHLDEAPGQARPVFQVLFADLLPSEEAAAAEALLSADESRLVSKVDDAMAAVLDVRLVPEHDAFTLNELSRRVHDPFPGRLTVAVEGEVTAVEGFAASGGEWTVPGLDLWGAFTALEGRWLAPDPATAYLETSLATSRFELDAGLARERRTADAPDAAEVRDALEAGLRPAPVYRLAWRVDG